MCYRFNGGNDTYDFAGAEQVQIKQNSDADIKRFCTLQLTVRATKKGTKQPRATVIFRGQGKRLSQAERDLWDKRVHVTFQPKAWADRQWCMEWGASEFARIVDEFVEKGQRACPIFDNLDGQCHGAFVSMLRGKC